MTDMYSFSSFFFLQVLILKGDFNIVQLSSVASLKVDFVNVCDGINFNVSKGTQIFQRGINI